MNALRTYAANGALTRATLVWKPGLSGWVPAEQLPELQAIFGAVPPPIPSTPPPIPPQG